MRQSINSSLVPAARLATLQIRRKPSSSLAPTRVVWEEGRENVNHGYGEERVMGSVTLHKKNNFSHASLFAWGRPRLHITVLRLCHTTKPVHHSPCSDLGLTLELYWPPLEQWYSLLCRASSNDNECPDLSTFLLVSYQNMSTDP